MKIYLKICGALAAAAALFAPATASAQCFNHLGLGAGVGTNGISVELATPLLKNWINLRAGVDFVPKISFKTDTDFEFDTPAGSQDGTVELTGNLKRTQMHLLFDLCPIPFARTFHITFGGYFGGNKLLQINGHSQELADYSQQFGEAGNVIIGDYSIPTDGKGNVSGGLKVKNFRPYLGFGWGKAIPGKFMNFAIDLGVQFQGKPKVYTDFGKVDISELEDDNTFNKIRDALSMYPVISFRLNFKAF